MAAYHAVKTDCLPVQRAAQLFGVPITTLKDRVCGRVPLHSVKSGPEPLFSMEEEHDLVQQISYTGSLGYGYTKAQVVELATDFALHLGKKISAEALSTKWLTGFLKRWPEMHMVKPQSLSTLRAKGASEPIIQ